MPESTTHTRPRAFAHRAHRAATTCFTYGSRPGTHISISTLCLTLLALGVFKLCVGAPPGRALVTIATSVVIFGLWMLAAPRRTSNQLTGEQCAWEATWAAEHRERQQAQYTSERLREARELDAERQRFLIARSPRL